MASKARSIGCSGIYLYSVFQFLLVKAVEWKRERMRRSVFILVFLLLMSTFHLALVMLPMNVTAAIHFVGGSGPGNYTSIQNAIDAADSGDLIYVYGGIYHERIEVNKHLSIEGEDRNATILDGDFVGNVVHITADWVNFTGFTVRNAGSDMENAGVRLSHVQNVRISGNNVSNNSQGIYIYYSDNNTIRDNLVMLNWMPGIHALRSKGNTIASNSIMSNNRGIFLEFSKGHTLSGNAMVKDGILIAGGTLDEWNTHIIDTSNTINGKPVIYWKNLTGGTVPPGAGEVILANCTDVVVSNQNLSHGLLGLDVGFSSRITIVNNTANYNRHGLYSWFSDNSTIIGNNFLSNWGVSVHLVVSSNNSISNNNVSDSHSGITLFFSTNDSVTGNFVSSNAGRGVFLAYTTGSVVATNSLLANGGANIRLDESNHNVIEYNTANGGSQGALLSKSGNNTVANNTFKDNFFGISAGRSYDNMIHHNSVVDSVFQASDFGINSWDNGYPSGGNFWSDYTGVDLKSGPNQDQPGSDGIGDTPYSIPQGSNEDRYPLMLPMKIWPTRPPHFESAYLSGKNTENVTLEWTLSPDDGHGIRDVTGYEVYRNMTYESNGLNYVLIASLPNETSQFVDAFAGEGNPSNYFYRVCAINSSGNSSCATNQAGKFSNSLSKGIDLLSIPLIQSNDSVQNVLQTVKFDKAWTYFPFENMWKSYVTHKPFKGDLRTVNHRMGVWVNVIEDSNLTVAGLVPSSTYISLKVGWNLVGYPSFSTSFTVGDLKAETGATRVESVDPSAPPYYLRVMNDGDLVQAGYGYWVHVESDSTWVVRNS